MKPRIRQLNVLLGIVIALFTIVPKLALAQLPTVEERKDSSHVFVFYNTIQGLTKLQTNLRDTLPSKLHIYDPVSTSGTFYSTLGNIGLPSRNLVPAFTFQRGFVYGRTSYDPYRFDYQQIPLYISRTAFSEIQFVMAPDKDNFLQAQLNRSLYKGLTLGLNYRLISSRGAYTSHDTYHNNFAANLRYFSKNKRYGIIGGYISNRFEAGLNGGISDDAEFEQNLEQNRKVISVNLSTAREFENEKHFYITHFFETGIYRKSSTSVPDTFQPNSRVIDTLFVKDTLTKSDSVRPIYKGEFVRLGRFSHTLNYRQRDFLFEDTKPDLNYYPAFYIDSTSTHDSVSVNYVENEFSWTNGTYLLENEFPIKMRFALKHQLVNYKSDSLSRTFNQIIPSATISLTVLKKFMLNADGFWVKGDYNDGDFGLTGTLTGLLNGQSWKIGANAALISEKPAFFYQYHYGNNFRWNNAFDRQDIMRIGVFLNGQTTELSVDYMLINDLVYFDTNAIAAQNPGQVSLVRAKLMNKLKLGRFYFDNLLVMQYVDEQSKLDLPLVNLRSSIYYSQMIFNQALLFEPGITVSFNTPYFSQSFSPSTSLFYLQTQQKTGGFAVIDLFANFKVNRARLFINYRHVNSSFTGFNYYGAPHYPLQDGGIVFGVNWPFYD